MFIGEHFEDNMLPPVLGAWKTPNTSWPTNIISHQNSCMKHAGHLLQKHHKPSVSFGTLNEDARSRALRRRFRFLIQLYTYKNAMLLEAAILAVGINLHTARYRQKYINTPSRVGLTSTLIYKHNIPRWNFPRRVRV